MREHEKSRKRYRQNKEDEDQLNGSYCQPDDEQFNNGYEEVTRKEKKKKKKRSIEENGEAPMKEESCDQKYDNQEIMEVTRIEKKKKKKRFTEGNEEAPVTEERIEKGMCNLTDDNQEMMVQKEEVTHKEKKKKKKRSIEENGEAPVKADIEKEIGNRRDDNQEMMVPEEKVTRKEKKNKKKRYTEENNKAPVKEEIEKETCDQRDGHQEIMVQEEGLTKKSNKRKHLAVNESDKLIDSSESKFQINGSPDVKKKKVSWRENVSESKEPEIFKDTKVSAQPPPANNSILSLLSNVNSISDQSFPNVIPSNNARKYLGKNNDRKLKLAMKKERRKVARKSKNDTRKLLMAQEKGQKSIEDCRIKNKKNVSEKDEELVLNSELSSRPSRKRSRSITPDREVIPGHKWKDLTEQQRDAFNKKREQRRKDKLFLPKVTLLDTGTLSSLRLEDEERTPLTLRDIQHFLIYSLYAHHSVGNISTWATIKFASKISKVVCVILDEASMLDYLQQEDQLPALKSFQLQLEVITPYVYGGDFAKEFWSVPLSTTQRRNLIKTHGSLEEAQLKGEAFESLKKLYPIHSFKAAEIVLPKRNMTNGIKKTSTKVFDDSLIDYVSYPDAFPRTELLLPSWDLVRESVPVPFATGYLATKYEGFVRTKDQYLAVTDNSPIWAVDCEMCETCQGSELTRISIINEDFEVVYESLVKPHNPITNYLTQFSGITPELLENEWTRLEDVQNDLRSLLPADVILAGHSVGSDLLAMKMFHPYVIDSSVCFNFSGVRGRKTKLKTLVAELLYERIQDGGKDGHDSVEDAASCLKLIKAKLSRYFEWGDAVLDGKRSEEESIIAQQQLLLRKDRKKMVYPVAENAIIRSGSRAVKSTKKPYKLVKKPMPVEAVRPPIEAPPAPPVQDYRMSNKPKDTEQMSTSLVNNLFSDGKKNLLVVGRGEFMKIGKEQANMKTKKAIRTDPRCVFGVQEDKNVLTYGCENAPTNGISILRVDVSKLKGNTQTPLEKADAMIKEAVKCFKETVLFTVLLPGKFEPEKKDPNHGLFMMKVFKPPFIPLTIEDIS